ncbi:MAG: hypothetical protein O7B99_01750 [Planctomycetota bacterium]|nr:hypothetical protein [Planctomycetota bacterium]
MPRHPRTLPVPAAVLLLLVPTACKGTDEPDTEGLADVSIELVENVELQRTGYRLVHPTNWSVDDEDPYYDPDGYFFLEGPDGALIAFMLFDEPADPKTLVDSMIADHGLLDAEIGEFPRWGRYEGYGIEVYGRTTGEVPTGMRTFAWSSDEQSFLVAESYFEFGYAAAKAGFEVIEMSFALRDPSAQPWPAVAPGAPTDSEGELEVVRQGFRLRFPNTWSVDTAAEDYDPDGSFTLLSPFPSCWMVVTILDGESDPDDVVEAAGQDMRGLLSAVDEEESFERWGRYSGAGLELKGLESNLAASLRIFCTVEAGRTLIITEFAYDELRDETQPGFRVIASSFEFLRERG